MTLRRCALCASSLLLLVACRPRVDPDRPAAPATAAAATAQAAPAPANQGPPPKLELVEKSHDAGKVKQGEPIRHTFVVKNNGLGELNIEKVQGS
jgi:hypothetical protein